MIAKRPVPQHLHGTPTGYQYGCRKSCCREAHANRERVRLFTGSGSRASVNALARKRPLGDTERAVVLEAEGMARSPRPTDVLAARKLARILDNPKLVGQWPRVTREFTRQLYVMHPKPEKRKGRLAAVRRMSNTTKGNSS